MNLVFSTKEQILAFLDKRDPMFTQLEDLLRVYNGNVWNAEQQRICYATIRDYLASHSTEETLTFMAKSPSSFPQAPGNVLAIVMADVLSFCTSGMGAFETIADIAKWERDNYQRSLAEQARQEKINRVKKVPGGVA